MNNTKIEIWEREREAQRNHYVARGTLLWGAVYTLGVSGVVYLTAPTLLGETPHFIVVLLCSLLICPSVGAVSGYFGWQIARLNPDTTRGRKDREGEPPSVGSRPTDASPEYGSNTHDKAA